ncbi:MAG: hypothetical protein ABI073_09370 [Luteolibacter sp.]
MITPRGLVFGGGGGLGRPSPGSDQRGDDFWVADSGQVGQQFLEVELDRQAVQTAVLHQRVDRRCIVAGSFRSEEQPVFYALFDRAYFVFLTIARSSL